MGDRGGKGYIFDQGVQAAGVKGGYGVCEEESGLSCIIVGDALPGSLESRRSAGSSSSVSGCQIRRDKEGNMFAAVKERMDLLAEGMEDMAVDEVVPCFRIAQSKDVGRHVVTTRQVTKGEVIFR